MLVVDDDPDVRATFREMLEDMGQTVLEAPNGRAALDFLVADRDVDVSLILLDLQMPVMNGWDFLDLLRHYTRLSAIPVVVISAFASLGKSHPSVVAWLRAPYPVSQLRELVQVHVQSDV
ncbi:MAG TPA: response regulator [Polyangiaceae bacterium]|nr:response regulator [Polyangiaceae bacterium]